MSVGSSAAAYAGNKTLYELIPAKNKLLIDAHHHRNSIAAVCFRGVTVHLKNI